MGNFITYYNIISFALFSAFVLYAFFVPVRRGRGETVAASPRHEKLWLLLALVFALGLRLWAFGLVPGGINQDGAMAAVDG